MSKNARGATKFRSSKLNKMNPDSGKGFAHKRKTRLPITPSKLCIPQREGDTILPYDIFIIIIDYILSDGNNRATCSGVASVEMS